MFKRISIDDLQLGMHVAGFGSYEPGHPFAGRAQTVTDQEVLEHIQASGEREIWIDTDLGIDAPDTALNEVQAGVDRQLAAAADSPARERTEMAVELEQAVDLLRSARANVERIFLSARHYRTLEIGLAQVLVAEIAASVERNPGALISLARLKEPADYTPLHSISVCALMLGLARQLELDPASTFEAGLGGLLHDIGKSFIARDLLDKPGRPSEAEFATLRSHTVLGYAFLAESSQVGPIPLEIALRHHERTDGSGYPQALVGEAIGQFAPMAAICDVYDAITSERPYQDSGQAAHAIRIMAAGAGKQFDQRLFHAFVKTVGIYPVGSMVRLASSRLAVVIEQGETSLLTPRVRAFFSLTDKRRIAPELIDLAVPGCEDRIVAREDAERWRFGRLEELWLGQPALAA
ncbi:MAG: HD-GYP domain-containing protein [Burkholderiaceae bacterium]